MVHRGTTRETKRLRVSRSSTPSIKLRRHRNKARIWRRAVRKLALALAFDERTKSPDFDSQGFLSAERLTPA